MTENTKIEWADHTMNFWWGCEAISPGCAHCYAELWAKRTGRDFAKRTRTSHHNWRQPEKWNKYAEKNGIRFRVFTNSLADFFDNQVPPEWRSDALALMLGCGSLDWLVLTKRIGNAQRMLDEAMATLHGFFYELPHSLQREASPVPERWDGSAPNIWIGATVVNQEEADRDIPKLLQIPARVRFLSCEPLLAELNLRNLRIGLNSALHKTYAINPKHDHIDPLQMGIDWVIGGGESGPHARPMHPGWVRSLRDQCVAAGVPFHFKQWGEWLPVDWSRMTDELWADDGSERPLQGRHIIETHHAQEFSKIGKSAAGRVLDGRTWDEFPR